MAIDTLRNHRLESQLFTARVVQLVLFILLLLLLLVARLIYLQVGQHQLFSDMSADNRVRVQPLPPTRGLIYDRHGEILAQNTPVHSLVIIPEKVADLEQTLSALADIVAIDEEDLARFERLRNQRRRFENIPLRTTMSESEVAIFAVNRHRFPGVDIEARLLRSYPHGQETSHVLGYVGRISDRDLESLSETDKTAYSGTSHIGKTGLEKYYETTLLGRVGLQRVEVNALGRTVRVIEERPPVPGHDLYLSLDLRLQQEAIAAFGAYTGAVVAIDPNSGSILAMISKPGFDANPFVAGISRQGYAALRNSPGKPLFNRALRGRYPPGSTTKPFFGLLGLESGTVTPKQRIHCPGYFRLPNHEHKYRDWKKRGHGGMDLTGAVVQSCDVYFYELSNQMGVQRMHDYLAQFGFGSPTGVDIVGEAGGLLPSPQWKRATRNAPWYPGETLIMGIGQGYFLTTPLELASGTATFAARGVRYRPHVVASIRDPAAAAPQPQQPVVASRVPISSEANWNTVARAMLQVVESPRGTAHRISTQAYRIAGKTGTAQVFTVAQDKEYDEAKVAQSMRDHALFIAYAPAEAPTIALAVVVENGGHGGSVAAPIAKRIIDRYLGEN